MTLSTVDSSYDIAVIGAGPAGAMAAREAARQDASVILVDKAAFPRTKVCGCCINHAALTTLTRVGLDGLPARLGAVPLHAMRLASGSGTAQLHLPEGAVLSRRALDSALVQSAQEQGVTFLDGARAKLEHAEAGQHCVMIERESRRHRISVRAIAVADGIAGRFLENHAAFSTNISRGSRLGIGAIIQDAPTDYESGTIHMACGDAGYVGLVRLECGALDVSAALAPRFVKRSGGAGPAVAACLENVGWPSVSAEANGGWRGTALLSRTRRPVAHAGIFLVGDAAGYIEPFTGEGIGWALQCGEAVADLLVNVGHDSEAMLARAWAQRYRRLVARRQVCCRGLAMLLRRPRLVRAAVGLLGHWPGAASPLVRAVSAPHGVS